MTEVYLALGSNIGDSVSNIAKAIELLGTRVKNIKTAPVYRSKPLGYTDQPDFLNTALSGQTTLSPRELFLFVKKTEQEIGRIKRFRWGPREIDIDIIFYGQEEVKTDDLEIPHPRYRERDFVLRPLLDLKPDLVDPVSQESLSSLLENLKNKTL